MCLIKNKISGQRPSQQQGFVLVLGLVLLTVVTLIGVSSMNSASVELKSATNAKQHQIAFYAVQSVIEYAISDDVAEPRSDGTAAILDYQTNKATTQSISYTATVAKDLDVDLDYVGCLPGAIGSSLEAGRGFGFNLYALTGTGSNANGTAFSEQVQGVRHVAASCQ